MNPKQTVPLLATLTTLAPAIAPVIPALLIGGAVFLVLNCLLSDDDKKTETIPADAEAERRRKEAETPVVRPIPPEILGKSAPVPVTSAPRAVTPAPVVKINPPAPVPAAVATPKAVTQVPPPPSKKKFITREDLASVFHYGARPLTRTAAVAALKKIGFGKTAAYTALTPDGRFADWLQFAPDGIITWTE